MVLLLFNLSLNYVKLKSDMVVLVISQVKVIPIALANVTIDKLCYIFTDSWTIDNGLVDWSATWRTTDWQIKDTVQGHKLWNNIEAPGWTIWIIHTKVHTLGKGSSCDETNWKQAA